MTAELMWFWGLLAANTLTVILYLVWNLLIGRGRKSAGRERKLQGGDAGQDGKPESGSPGRDGKPEGRSPGRDGKPESGGPGRDGEPESRSPGQDGKPESRSPGQGGKPEDGSGGGNVAAAEGKPDVAEKSGSGGESAEAPGGAAPKPDRRRGVWLRAAVMFLCPVAGPCMFLFSQIFFRLFFSKPVDLEDVVFSKERVRTFVHADEDRERNIVPLEEAIEITDAGELRNLMMNVVRGDISKSLASIALALNSEDTETAHYAASVLQDALNDFRFHVQKQYKLIRAGDENQVVYAEALIDYMNRVLEQKVFADMEQKSYVDIMDEVCEVLYGRDREHMTSAQYEAISLRLLETGDYEKCRKWCDRAEYQYPNTLATYTCQLKLYFNSGQKQRFFEVMDALKHSAVVIDSETLELIRVFR